MTTWMDFEGIMLSEISQTEKDKYYMISLMCGIKKQKQRTSSQIQRTDWRLPEVGQDGGMGEMGEGDQRFKKRTNFN